MNFSKKTKQTSMTQNETKKLYHIQGKKRTQKMFDFMIKQNVNHIRDFVSQDAQDTTYFSIKEGMQTQRRKMPKWINVKNLKSVTSSSILDTSHTYY